MAQQNTRIKVKVTNNDDTRLWRYSNTTDYEGLCAFIQSVWQNDDFIAQYKDDEGDLITIASAQDLADAFDLAVAEQMKSLKLFVKFDVKQKRAQQQRQAYQQQPTTTSNVKSEEKKQDPVPPKQFGSIHEMIVDFLSNTEITALLPELFGSFVSTLMETAKVANGTPRLLELEEITALLAHQVKDERFNVISQHPLYQRFAALAIPLVARKVHAQQHLYPHFNLSTIKTWVTQLLGMLTQVVPQMQGQHCRFTDVVIDIEYPSKTDTGKVIHFGVECDLCGMYPIIGDRYKCSICEDWDCCSACEPQHDHPLIKFKKSSKKYGNAFKGLAEMMQKLSAPSVQPEPELKVQEVSDEKDELEVDVLEVDEVLQEEREEPVSMEVNCICGAKLMRVAAQQAYMCGNEVFCDGCGCGLKGNDAVFHCAKGKDLLYHPGGFDLCTLCATKKITADEAKAKEVEERKTSEVEKAKEVEVVEPPKVEEVEEVEEVPPPKEEFVYAGQLAQIKEIMAIEGGDMDETIKKMLVEHKGDLARVVPLLLR